jgi:plasmid stabilization system protein ParE
MRVVFSDAALSDLDAIANWIGRDSREQAEAFVLAVGDKCLSLSKHPNRYPAVHLPPLRNLRKLTYRGYLIFYQATALEVEVIHILQGSRDWEAVLRGEAEPKNRDSN